MQEIITGLGVQCLTIWAKQACAIWGSLNFCSFTTCFFYLDDLVRINRAWLYKDLKVSDLQESTILAQLVKLWTLKPVIISCIGGNFFSAVVKSFNVNTAISANFVLTVKTSNQFIMNLI